MNKIILCRGIQASGKTTYSKKWVSENPQTRIRINNDDIRFMLGSKWDFSKEDLVRSVKKQLAIDAMVKEYDIIVDNLNLNPKEIQFWTDIINYCNGYLNVSYSLEFKDFFDVSVEECILRDSKRNPSVGETVIRNTWKKYKHFIQTTEVEKYVNNLRAWSIGKPTCIVVDMDSTLCFNTTKRPWFGEGAAEGMKNDIPNSHVLDIIFTLSNTYPIILATGRDTSQEQVTLEWLANHEIYPNECYFRTEGDHRKGVEVKREQIEKIASKYNILAIFDDCEPIVKMYREMGFTVLQPNKGL